MDEKRIPLHLVVARIVAASGIGFSSAMGLFLVVAEQWGWGLASLAATVFFIFLMFLIERGAAGDRPA